MKNKEWNPGGKCGAHEKGKRKSEKMKKGKWLFRLGAGADAKKQKKKKKRNGRSPFPPMAINEIDVPTIDGVSNNLLNRLKPDEFTSHRFNDYEFNGIRHPPNTDFRFFYQQRIF